MDANEVTRAERLGSLFAEFVQVAFRERVVGACGLMTLTYPQYAALRYLQNHPRCTVGELARGLRVSYPSATHMAQRLYQRGLVRKYPLPMDRRVVRLEVTEDGVKVLEKVREAQRSQVQSVLDKLGESERLKLLDVLDRFITTMTSAGVVRADDLCLRCGTDGDDACPLIGAQVGYQCR